MMDERRHNDDVILTELKNLKELVALDIEYLKEQLAETKIQTEKMGERIRAIEVWQNQTLGKMAVIFTIVGIGVTILISWVTRHF